MDEMDLAIRRLVYFAVGVCAAMMLASASDALVGNVLTLGHEQLVQMIWEHRR